jgi:hypothetical protein
VCVTPSRGDELLIAGLLYQCGDDGEARLRGGREKQGAEPWEARRFSDNHTYQGGIAGLAHLSILTCAIVHLHLIDRLINGQQKKLTWLDAL